MFTFLIINLENIGLIITVSAVVFIVLFLCYKIFTLLWKWSVQIRNNKVLTVNSLDVNKKSEKPLENQEDIAAISMALHLFLNENRDEESEIITIDMPSAHYSPWAQKHLVMKRVVRKK